MKTIKIAVDLANLLSRLVDKALEFIDVVKNHKETELKKLQVETDLNNEADIVGLKRSLLKATLEQHIAEANARRSAANHKVDKHKQPEAKPEHKRDARVPPRAADPVRKDLQQGTTPVVVAPEKPSEDAPANPAPDAPLRAPIRGVDGLRNFELPKKK